LRLQESTAELACPHCDGAFIEQVEEFRFPAAGHGHGHGHAALGGGGAEGAAEGLGLTDEQRRRLFNAAALLQLLEAHLREEFLALESAVREAEANKAPRHLSGLEKHVFLKTAPVDADSLCSQPACPICSEDFNVDEEALQIQCSHFFHESCVVPWLELKHNCPICRCEVSDKLPSPEQIQELTATEIRQRIAWHGQEPSPSENKYVVLCVLCCRPAFPCSLSNLVAYEDVLSTVMSCHVLSCPVCVERSLPAACTLYWSRVGSSMNIITR
jgi:hypothetical protein